MPEYDLHVVCPHCQGFHDAFVRVSLEETFEVLRVSDVYHGDVPLYFYQAIAQISCSATNKHVNQSDPHMMVLAEVGRWSLRKKLCARA
jgi:hypothetical protein